MKNLITIAAVMICLTAHAQHAVKDAQGNYHAVTRSTDTGARKPTGKTFTDSKGKSYPLYLSVNGKLYYMRTSRSGNVYKAYIKE